MTCVTALWLEAVRQQVQTTLSAHTYIPALLVNTTTNMHVHDATVEQLLCKRTQNNMLAMGKWVSGLFMSSILFVRWVKLGL